MNIIKLTILSVSLSFIFGNLACNKEKPNTTIQRSDTSKIKSSDVIKFVKQGEVYFQDINKNLKKQIDVEVADNDDRRHIGLMFRDKMEENQGMLFIFQKPEEQSFWMKNTLIPLDIIFIDAKKQIIKIHKNTTPLSEQSLPSGKDALYVVEVIGGFTSKFNIKEGDFIDFKRM